MASTPQARAAYLLGLSKEKVSTPVTLTGGWGSVFSYALHIAYKSDEGFRVLNIKSSQTTNRHIRACHAALQAAGYVADGTAETPDTVYRYYGAERITRTWTVYRLAETVAAEKAKPTHYIEPDNNADLGWHVAGFGQAKIEADDYLAVHPECEWVPVYPVSDPFAPPDYEAFRAEAVAA